MSKLSKSELKSILSQLDTRTSPVRCLLTFVAIVKDSAGKWLEYTFQPGVEYSGRGYCNGNCRYFTPEGHELFAEADDNFPLAFS